MIEVHQRLGQQPGQQAQHQVVLSHEQRDRGRLRLHSTTGLEVRVFLDRGKPLEVGELLQANNGELVEVVGATEQVCVAYCDDWQLFSRACYHLGNRHVRLQVGDRWLRIKPDHVLADMLIGLGLEVEMAEAVFVPESGAYAQGGHTHGHGHTHDHAHSHADDHARGHVHAHSDEHGLSHDHTDCTPSHTAQTVLPISAPKRKTRSQASGHSHG